MGPGAAVLELLVEPGRGGACSRGWDEPFKALTEPACLLVHLPCGYPRYELRGLKEQVKEVGLRDDAGRAELSYYLYEPAGGVEASLDGLPDPPEPVHVVFVRVDEARGVVVVPRGLLNDLYHGRELLQAELLRGDGIETDLDRELRDVEHLLFGLADVAEVEVPVVVERVPTE